jgi:hypothetical protein
MLKSIHAFGQISVNASDKTQKINKKKKIHTEARDITGYSINMSFFLRKESLSKQLFCPPLLESERIKIKSKLSFYYG